MNYLSNKNILQEVIRSKQQGQMTAELGSMLLLLTDRFGSKHQYSQYTYLEEMKSEALLNLCKVWYRFDENKSNNPFAFYTQCIKNSFTQVLNRERKVRDLRDKLLVEAGLNPSFTYQEADAEERETRQ